MLDLRSTRKELGLSVTTVAKKVGVCPPQIRRYERGDRLLPVIVAQRFGALYGINWWELYPNYVSQE